MKPKLEYTSNGRHGYVVYKDHTGELSFYYEFGGGKCVAIINVPSQAEWIKQTNRLLAEREEILTFVAAQAMKDQVKNGYYEIKEAWIEIMTR
ncbi:MAG TPA: hypothetical protein VFF90_02160 [Saprospiraceae bacterium]|nr:hypothetical protein [Saprospiraceae bacterium]